MKRVSGKSKRSSLSLCMIVRDEERFLSACLESVKTVVDEMIIVDTGSTDGTVDVARRYGAEVHHFTWTDDFSAARNFGLPFARGEWILQLDADEEVVEEDIPLVRRAVEGTGYDGVSVVFLNDGPNGDVYKHRNVRLFRNGKVRYRGIVHNVPVVDGPVALSSIRILHHGYDLPPDAMQRKFERSEALLVKQVTEDPTNTYGWANLVRNYRLQDKFEEAILTARRALGIDGIRLYDKQMILNDTMYALWMEGKTDEAESAGREGLAENPVHLDLLFMMGNVMVERRKYEEAIAFYEAYLDARASGAEAPGLEGLLIDTYGHQGRAWNNIACCYRDMGMNGHAIDAWQSAVSYEPDNLHYHKSLAHALLSAGRTTEAAGCLETAVETGIADGPTHEVLERLAIEVEV